MMDGNFKYASQCHTRKATSSYILTRDNNSQGYKVTPVSYNSFCLLKVRGDDTFAVGIECQIKFSLPLRFPFAENSVVLHYIALTSNPII